MACATTCGNFKGIVRDLTPEIRSYEAFRPISRWPPSPLTGPHKTLAFSHLEQRGLGSLGDSTITNHFDFVSTDTLS